MTVFVFDYSGTLDRLTSPVTFIADLRRMYLGCRVVLYTGSMQDTIEHHHPGLWKACDQVLLKPCSILDALDDKTARVVYVDDESPLRAMAARSARKTPTVPWEILEPGALLGLAGG